MTLPSRKTTSSCRRHSRGRFNVAERSEESPYGNLMFLRASHAGLPEPNQGRRVRVQQTEFAPFRLSRTSGAAALQRYSRPAPDLVVALEGFSLTPEPQHCSPALAELGRFCWKASLVVQVREPDSWALNSPPRECRRCKRRRTTVIRPPLAQMQHTESGQEPRALGRPESRFEGHPWLSLRTVPKATEDRRCVQRARSRVHAPPS